MATVMPASYSALLIAAPSPPIPPVMKATRPVSMSDSCVRCLMDRRLSCTPLGRRCSAMNDRVLTCPQPRTKAADGRLDAGQFLQRGKAERTPCAEPRGKRLHEFRLTLHHLHACIAPYRETFVRVLPCR